MTDTRLTLDYSNRDYKSIRAQLVGLAKGYLPEWKTVGETGDMGTLLIELYAYAGDVMHYYIDRMVSEAFLGTASRRQSVLYIADMLGYTPTGQTAASVPLTFTWAWNPNETQPEVLTYTIDGGVVDLLEVTLEIQPGDYAPAIVEGQTIRVSGLGEPFDGLFKVLSTEEAVGEEPFKFTYKINTEGVLDTTLPGQVSVGQYVRIPEGTIVYSSSNDETVFFETNYEVVLDSSTAVTVNGLATVTTTTTASEGLTVAPTALGESKGVPNAEFVIPDPGVIDFTTKVYTRESGQVIPWARLDRISLARPAQSAYTVYIDDDNYTHILFGDNISGRIPPAGAQVLVSYRYGTGLSANSLGKNSITGLSDDYANSLGVKVTNPAAPVGGTDVESAESMRYSIPRTASVRDRGVTLDDLSALALMVPGVAKAVAYGQVYSTVYIRIAANEDSSPYQTGPVSKLRTKSGKTTLITPGASHQLVPDNKVFLEGLGEAEYAQFNGNWTVDKVWASSTTSIDITEVRTGGTQVEGIVDYVTATFSTGTLNEDGELYTGHLHGFTVGQPITITGLEGSSGDYLVTSIPDSVRFTVQSSSLDELTTTTPDAGTVKVHAQAGILVDSPEVEDIFLNFVPGTSRFSYADPEMALLIDALEAYLSDKKIADSVVYGEPVGWLDVFLSAELHVLPLYNRTDVRDEVQARIEEVLAFKNVEFGQRITPGEVYRAALGVDGVEYLLLNRLSTTVDGAVEDIETPDYVLPRLAPSLASGWLSAVGGLANT